MTNEQRIKNDISTVNRREMTDKTVNDSRMRNDEETADRSYFPPYSSDARFFADQFQKKTKEE